MNLYLRLLLALVSGLRRPPLHHGELSEREFRVWPHDLDAFGHMNNGRYLQIMDVARTEWMVRARVARAMRRNRWSAVLGGGLVRYRYSLRPFQRYQVRTRLLCWDERWFFLEHVFIDGQQRRVAVGVTRAALRSRGHWLPTATVVDAVAAGALSPPAPAYLGSWLSLEEEMFQAGRPAPEGALSSNAAAALRAH
jgi:acyl-CoA thioesterase FadM